MASPASSASSSDIWSASAYLRFEEPRTRPGLELINRLQSIRAAGACTKPIRTIADLGCGTGRFLAPLVGSFPDVKRVFAVDSSSNMLASGRSSLPSSLEPLVDWQLGDLAHYAPESSIDLLFSNAALHWIPDHLTLFPRLLSFVSPGGMFAVQIPNNFHEPSHISVKEVINELATEGKIEQKIKEELDNIAGVMPAKAYHQLLEPECSYVDVFEVKYLHALEEPITNQPENDGSSNVGSAAIHPVLSWVRGSTLSPVLPRLSSDPTRNEFLSRYTAKLHQHYPTQRKVNQKGESILSCIFPFKRIFMIGVRKL